MTTQDLRRRDVERTTGLSRGTICRLMDADEFPRPVKLTPRGTAVGWWRHEIEEWIKKPARVRVRREDGA
ncbi:helix-turn-helix transcriptional regulator [Candidatus Palauibacter sp.]|uniref:helix-turn-helix transcriptional regulator n=1 Tax=Candidatus Palauibacter sp. TaxID=3101350 RepID=UPI003C700569